MAGQYSYITTAYMYGHRRVSGDDEIVRGVGVEVDRLGRGQEVAQAVG